MSAYKCMWCEDTGRDIVDHLTCKAPDCTAAQERTELMAFMGINGGLYQHTLDDLAWMIHQRAVAQCEAKAAAALDAQTLVVEAPKRRMDDK